MRERSIAIMLLLLIIVFIGCKKDKDLGQRQPKVTNEEVTTTSNSATISWMVDFPGHIHSGIEIGLDEDLADAHNIEASNSQINQNIIYTVTIDGLLPKTKYYYRQVVWNSYNRYELETKDLKNLCYSISVLSNPDNGGVITGGGTYEEGRLCTITATPSPGFIFVCWKENGNMVSDDPSYKFEVENNRDLVAHFSREYIDLGLPSGNKWATCNVGSDSYESIGSRFSWAEINTKDDYSWNTYHYCNGVASTLTKYCCNSSHGNDGFTDNLTTLLPEDDAAMANWGVEWRTPTRDEWQELYQYTVHTWTSLNGVTGLQLSSSNGASLFLPFGYHYWSSSLNTSNSNTAWIVYFSEGSYGMDCLSRNCGLPIRPVCSMP